MTNKDKRSKIIKPIIICLLLLGVVVTYFVYVNYRTEDYIEYKDRKYNISSFPAITDKDEISKIKSEYPYTHKKDNGYKIYAVKGSMTCTIYGENKKGEFYQFSLAGSL